MHSTDMRHSAKLTYGTEVGVSPSIVVLVLVLTLITSDHSCTIFSAPYAATAGNILIEPFCRKLFIVIIIIIMVIIIIFVFVAAATAAAAAVVIITIVIMIINAVVFLARLVQQLLLSELRKDKHATVHELLLRQSPQPPRPHRVAAVRSQRALGCRASGTAETGPCRRKTRRGDNRGDWQPGRGGVDSSCT